MEKCSRCMGVVKDGVCTDCLMPVNMAKSNEERLRAMFKTNIAAEEKSESIAVEKEAPVKSAADALHTLDYIVDKIK